MKRGRLHGGLATGEERRAKSERPDEAPLRSTAGIKPAASDGRRAKSERPSETRSSPRRVGKPAASDARRAKSERPAERDHAQRAERVSVRRDGPSATERDNAGNVARSPARGEESNVARVTGADRPSLFENGRRSFRRRRGGARAQRVIVVVGRMMAAFRERRSERRGPKHIAVAKPSRLGTGVICRRPRLCEDGGGTKSGQSRNLRRESPHAQSRNAASQSTRFVTEYSLGSRSPGPGNERALSAVRDVRARLGSLAASRARDRRTQQ